MKPFAAASLLIVLLIFATFPMVGQVRSWYDPFTNEAVFHVNLVNEMDQDFDDVMVRVQILDLDPDAYGQATSRRDVNDGEKDARYVQVPLPRDVEPGYYMARVLVSNDDHKDYRYTYVWIGDPALY